MSIQLFLDNSDLLKLYSDMSNERLQKILAEANSFKDIPEIGIIAMADFTGLGHDRNLSKDEIIAEMFGYLKLNHELNIPLDGVVVGTLRQLGATVEEVDEKLVLTLES